MKRGLCVAASLLFLLLLTPAPLSTASTPLSVNEWPSGGETRLVWEQRIPRPVLEDAKQVLHGDVKTWRARDFALLKNVVWLFDQQDHCIVFLVQPNKWVRLNDHRGLSYILKAFSETLHLTENDLKSGAIQTGLLSCLYQGYDGLTLTDNLFKLNQGNPRLGPKDPALYKPSHRIESGKFTFTYNSLTSRGGIDHWELKGTIDNKKRLILTSISVTSLKPDKSYDWPIEGGFY